MNTEPRKTTADHLSEAMHSTNLSSGHDIDYLTALGMAGIRSRRASTLFRLVNSLDAQAYKAALVETTHLVSKMNAKYRWKLVGKSSAQLAKTALDFFICPVCPSCRGRRYELIHGTPNLSPIACKHCKGTGINHPPKKWREQVLRLASELETGIDILLGGVRKRIRNTSHDVLSSQST